MDIGLPGQLDGFDVCRRLGDGSRSSPVSGGDGTSAVRTTPVLILSARDDEVDRVLGLELGADDYVTKPFSARELVARVHAILRRTAAAQGPRAPAVVALGGIEVDTGRREVRLDGEVVPLATREFELLAYLVDNLGLALSRRQLLNGVWGADWFGDERTVDVHVRQLRKKLGDRPTAGHRLGRRLPAGMRRRLTIAILLLVAGTLIVTSVGSYVLIRREAISTSQRQLASQAQAISRTFSKSTVATGTRFVKELGVISDAGAFAGIAVIGLNPDGSIRGRLPAGVTTAMLDIPALRAGQQVTGHTGSLLLYSAVPTPLARVSGHLPGAGGHPPDPQPGRRDPLLRPGRRPSASSWPPWWRPRWPAGSPVPLAAAVAATRRIASGDLDAKVASRPERGPGVRPTGRVDQHHGGQPGSGPGPGAAVPPVGLPRAADAADLDPGLRRRGDRRGHRRSDRRPP